jgi:protein-disulfide isomerase
MKGEKMKNILKVIFLSIFCALFGASVYFQLIHFALNDKQLTVIAQNQQKIMQDIKAIKSQLASAGGFQRPAMQPQRPSVDVNKIFQIDSNNSPYLGNKNAKVTITEFSDFQCPYSQRFHPVIQQVMKAYPDKVKFVFENFPLQFHPFAKPAAKATLAAREQGKYWEMVDAIFEAGKDLNPEKFQELAKKIGLNVAKFNSDLKAKDADYEKFIEEDLASAKIAEVRGTPTFFINGKLVQGRSFEDFKAAIDKILQGEVKK